VNLQRPAVGGPDAGQMDHAIAPDLLELPPLRTAIGEWLRSDPEHLEVVDDAVLVASEMAHIAVRHGSDDHPVVLHLWRTHSILVIEVGFQSVAPEGEIVAAQESSAEDLGARIIEHLTDRMVVESMGGTATMRCTFSLAERDAAGPEHAVSPARLTWSRSESHVSMNTQREHPTSRSGFLPGSSSPKGAWNEKGGRP
jgi:hypothetical protein